MNLMKSSATVYCTLLYLYPASVRRNDGDAMMQVFRDLAPGGKVSLLFVVLYTACLLVFVGYGAIGFHDYYARPTWSVDLGAGKTVNEDEILRLADAAAPQYDRYVRYWQFGGLTLTVLLGITTAIFARWLPLAVLSFAVALFVFRSSFFVTRT